MNLNDELAIHIMGLKLPPPCREYRISHARKYLWDFAWPKYKFWVEVDGGEYMRRSGHKTAKGMRRDREKDIFAFFLGWRGFRVTGSMVKDGSAIAAIEKFFMGKNK